MLASLFSRWGTNLAGLAGLAAAYLVADPVTARALIDLLPDGPWRTLAGVGVGFLVFVTAASAGAADVRKAKKPE